MQGASGTYHEPRAHPGARCLAQLPRKIVGAEQLAEKGTIARGNRPAHREGLGWTEHGTPKHSHQAC